MLPRMDSKNSNPAASVTSLLSSSSNSSGASASSTSGQSSSMAVATAVHKMDAELRCPSCKRYFHCPLLLPCGHSLCTSCAAGSLAPATEPSVAASIHSTLAMLHSHEGYRASVHGTTHSSSSSASSTAGSSIIGTVQMNLPLGLNPSCTGQNPVGSSSHSDSDQLSVVSETDSGVVVSSRPGSYIGRLPAILCQSAISTIVVPSTTNVGTTNPTPIVPSTINANLITHGLICPSCNRTVGLLDEHGLSQLPRNRALERVIGKFVSPELLQEKPPVEIGTFPLLPPSDPISRPGGPLCQLCEDPEDVINPSTTEVPTDSHAASSTPNLATTWCEQCEIFYCTPCRERCHPSRGPLMRHCLHTAAKGVELAKQKRQNQPAPCPVHPHMLINFFCVPCQIQVCNECLITEGTKTHESHGKHEVQPLNSICKTRKTELSQALQSLSERARSGTECIQRLRIKSEAYNHKMLESERQVAEQLDMLIRALEQKKTELIERLRVNREEKVQCMKEQITQVTSMLTKSTGLIQFCIEMLKESDPTAFLVVSQSLITRTHDTEHLFIQELEQASVVNDHAESLLNYSVCSASTKSSEQRGNSPRKTNKCKSDSKVSRQRTNDFTLEHSTMETIRRAITELRLSEEQGKKPIDEDAQSSVDLQTNEVPAAPRFIVEACISERNVITLVWQPTSSTVVTKYTLELDDGANGNFRKVYRGPETICTVEGLHFRSVYRARVKAHNPVGESLYSERLCLQTSDLTWFHMDPSTACPDLLLTNGNRTVTSQINEDRIILGSTGLSRGVHYWEFTVDRCDPGGQPAFGIARVDCNKEIMLGLDMRSWSVYFDHKRSWFLHNGEHFERTDGGVRPGSVVGVRLDFNRGSLSYYLNDEPHGPIAFTNLPAGVYYPAVSLTRAVQLTLHSGLEAPSESEESDEDSSGGGTGTETTSMATTVLAMPSNKIHAHQLPPNVSKP